MNTPSRDLDAPPPPAPAGARRPSDSVTTMTEYVLPTHTNALGTIFGGQVLAWIDLCAAICAQRHTGRTVITAGIDDLSFDRSILVGQVVRLHAKVTATFRTSLEILVMVQGEDATRGDVWPTVTAFVTFVAVDAAMRPVPVPPLLVEGHEERRLAEAAAERRERRLARRHQGRSP
ncbi:acyl-CoA thioesterase [Chondromyces apiculatus]|uniref:Acyl-CoA thioester hydrolase n=1 Tax=Chondromyces apiculatus DSM 436 TaxID=1192034 RepID=A0A017TH72_9BACT|nr:acyl-CoA thioesterase [Chondromyces apiculatus]EYF08613.1 Acyl-CoA thioester hydrolase [Chondromyces apiculatus DSM 436]